MQITSMSLFIFNFDGLIDTFDILLLNEQNELIIFEYLLILFVNLNENSC